MYVGTLPDNLGPALAQLAINPDINIANEPLRSTLQGLSTVPLTPFAERDFIERFIVGRFIKPLRLGGVIYCR